MWIFYLDMAFRVAMGVAVMIIVLAWKKQRGKGLLLAFVVTSFIGLPLLSATQFVTLRWMNEYGSFEFYEQFETLSTVFQALFFTLSIASGILLILYAAACKTNPQTEEPYQAYNGPQWSLSHDPKIQVQIMRKREWGFLFDFMPFVMIITVSVMASAWHNNLPASRGLATILSVFSTLTTILWVPYILFKDSLKGVSFGKYYSGCRVVDELGHPISLSYSVLRNLIFLIPLMPMVELVVANVRKDRRRLGDLMANTYVVTGPPNFYGGKPVIAEPVEKPKVQKKHALDD